MPGSLELETASRAEEILGRFALLTPSLVILLVLAFYEIGNDAFPGEPPGDFQA